MNSHLKIEIFSYDLFNSVWLIGKLISNKLDATEIYKDECLLDNDFKEVCDNLFYNAVLCRRILFQRIYVKEIMKETYRNFDSVTDFYDYIHSTCNHYEWIGCLTVFERMFATCGFVLNLCYYIRENENVDIIKVGHKCWAKYFDAFTEEFYEQGGWSQLKTVANFYTLPLRSLQMCLNDPENALAEVTEAVENYTNLKQTSIMRECETVSMLWIKSHINNLERYRTNPVELADYENWLHAEYILNELKRLCGPCVLEIVEFDEECSERLVFDSDSFYQLLKPIASQELMVRKISISDSSDDNSEDAVPTVDSDLTNDSCLSEHVGITSCNYCDDISCACLETFTHPIEFESINLISDCEQVQCLSRSLNKLKLNHDTLELEKTTISDTDFSNSTNDTCSVTDSVSSTTDKNLVPQEMNKHYQILENPMDAIKSVSKNTWVKKLSVTEGKQSHKGFDGEIAPVTTFSNADFSYDNQLFLSIAEWDEKDLSKNISTPIKQKQS